MTTTTRTVPRSHTASRDASGSPSWETEAIVLAGTDRADLLDRVTVLEEFLARSTTTDLTDLAFTLNRSLPTGGVRLAIVAKSVDELRQRLSRAREKLAVAECEQIRDTSGIYFHARPLGLEGKVAFLFPGEGAHYPGMLRDVVQAFPEVRRFLDEADAALATVRGDEPPVSQMFLGPRSPATEAAMQRLDNTMLSVLLADGALHRVMQRLGIEPALAAGHSMGEMAALSAASAANLDEGFLDRFATTMRRLEEQEASDAEYLLLAVGTGKAGLASALDDPTVYVAMDNCPHQTILVGPVARMAALEKQLVGRGLVCERLPFRRPYHTPMFEGQLGPLRELFPPRCFHTPSIPVYSCTTASPFPQDPEAIRELVIRHWAEPVRFTELIQTMHTAGARLFIEVGPRGNLSAFVEDILRGQSFAALPANVARRSGLTQLNHLVAQLAAHHVPLRLEDYFAPRTPTVIELPWDTRSTPVPPALTPETHSPREEVDGEHSAVMKQYFAVMEQFLDVQAAVTEAYLCRTTGPVDEPTREVEIAPAPLADSVEPTAPPVRPLLGEIIEHTPEKEVVVRRRLDLRDDLFVQDHTVGGRMVSRVDPEQHGVPVMPMTFMLEILAETAGVLAPGRVAIGLRNVRLLRWLAFEADEPSIIEVSAKFEERRDTGELALRAEIRDLGPECRPHSSPLRVAQGQVLFADHYPAPPETLGLPGESIAPIDMTVEQVYHNLFHGPRFQGVRRTIRGSDISIEAEIEILPRGELFRSHPEPTFHLDPVMLDVVLHPLATWHLHQPDLAGRIMLPVGIESAQFFAPPAAVGERFQARAWISEANLRSFSHDGEAIAADGSVYLRLKGVKCWRFYVPFGEVNFHGPKDQYFLGRRWTEMETQAGTRASDASRFALVRLEIPPDLKQPAMSRVTAQVTLTPTEIAEFRHRNREGDGVHTWLFDRIAAKDAIRILWHDRTGERLFPADIEAECEEAGIPLPVVRASRRGKPEDCFDGAVVARAGSITAALATNGPQAGLAMAELESDVNEQRGRLAVEACGGGTVEMLAEDHAVVRTPSGECLRVHFGVDEQFVIAWTLGEKGTA